MERQNGDRSYTCITCGDQFVLEKNEIAWYEEKFGAGELPRRCKPCRQELRRKRRNEEQQEREEGQRDG